MDFHDFPRFLGKSGMDLMYPPPSYVQAYSDGLSSSPRARERRRTPADPRLIPLPGCLVHLVLFHRRIFGTTAGRLRPFRLKSQSRKSVNWEMDRPIEKSGGRMPRGEGLLSFISAPVALQDSISGVLREQLCSPTVTRPPS